MRQYKLKAELEYYNGEFTELDWIISEVDKCICAACTSLDYEDLVWTLRGKLYDRRSKIAGKKSNLKHQLKRRNEETNSKTDL